MTRSSRSMARAGAVVAVLLATLLHILGCCHGPPAAATPRADALSQTAPHAYGAQLPDRHPETRAGQSTPAPDEDAHCCGLGEPTVQPPRGPSTAGPPFLAVVPSEPPATGLALPPSACHDCPLASAAFSTGHGRALLGVWRT
ncbi:hypothetical protein ACVB8X_39695 [Streptomyces sp. NRAIS4]